ncbi:MAG: hypothetical protein RL013_2104 [Bacteroidota bacterium]
MDLGKHFKFYLWGFVNCSSLQTGLLINHSFMFISGIQQIGIGVDKAREAFNWYRVNFGMDLVFFEDAAVAKLMLPYTGGKPRARHAILALNLNGGGGMEIWQYTERKPEPPAFTPEPGDLGISVAKIKCADAAAAEKSFRAKGLNVLTSASKRPDGNSHFFVRDPWNNLFEVVESTDWFSSPGKNGNGGVYGAIIGVSDMERSIRFYMNVLGFNQIMYDQTGQFPDLKGVAGGEYRRVLLRHPEKRKGPFSRLLGDAEIELIQTLDKKPRKIFENRFWGDLGYIHLCFDVNGMDDLKKFCTSKGHPFTVDSSGSFEMGEAAGAFAYIEDPDGTLIEFVEPYRLPIVKKWGWNLDFRKRSNPAKPLPSFLLKALRFRRKKKD